MLRVHLLKDSGDAVGMLLGHREDDRFSGQLAGLILEARLHDLLPLFAEGVSIADLDFDLRAPVVEAVGVDALLGESVAVFFAEVHALDAFALETGVRLVKAEINEESCLYGLWIVIEKGWRIGIAPEEPEGVTVDKAGGGSSQADHAGIEVLDDFGEPLKERAVGFIEDDQVEKARAELGVAERHRLLGSDEEAFGFVDLMRVDPIARLVRQVGFETICQGLIDEGVTVGEEENILRLVGAEKDIDQGHGHARLAGAGGHNEECAPFVSGEGFSDAANRLVLIGTVDYGAVNRGRFERSPILAQEVQPLEVGGREEPGHEARISKADLPEPDVMAVGHEPKGRKGLPLCDLGDVVPQLFVGLACVAGASLG